MSGLFGSLNSSVKGLNAQQAGVETAGRNLANLSNTNYARQRVIFSDRGTVQTAYGPQSLGIEAVGTLGIRDSLLDAQLVRELSLMAELEMGQSALKQAQAGLGQSIDRASGTSSTTASSGGLSESLSDFFLAFEALAAKPTDTGERQTLLQKAEILVDRFNLTDSRLAQVQTDMTNQIKSDVESINTLLSSIAELNGQINRLEVNTRSEAASLRDSRQQMLEELAGKMGFETRAQPGGEGQLQVYTRDSLGNEVVLVAFAEAATLTTDAGATTVTATNLPGTGTPSAIAVSSGAIKGAMDARDVSIKNLRTEIDTLARQVVIAVNDAYNPSGTGDDFFVATGLTAATIERNSAIKVTTLEPDQTSGGAAGDPTIPAAVAALAVKQFSTAGGDLVDGTLSQYYINSVSDLGQALAGLNTRLSDQENIEALVRSQRDAVSGVSLDEEVADLLKYQRAFQANSKVISAIDEMLDTVINRMA